MQVHSESFDFLNVYKFLHTIYFESNSYLSSDFKVRLHSNFESLYQIEGTRGTQSDLSGAEY